MIAVVLLAAMVAGAEPGAATPAPEAGPDRAALVAGKIPGDPERAVLEGRCLVCHTLDYVTTQRLSEAQWTGVIGKMKRWGSPIADDEVKPLAAWLARTWSTGLPERDAPRMRAPSGSTPAPARQR
jgi:hypothetical protein